MGTTKSQSGYTLIEIMMVCAIAGLLAMMGGVAFSVSTDRYNFENERAKFYQALSRARTVALTRQECVRVTLSSGNSVVTEGFATSGPDRSCVGPFTTSTVTLSPVTFHQDTVFGTFSTGTNVLIFNSTGGVDADDIVTYELADTKGNRANFRIFPAIGQIRVN